MIVKNKLDTVSRLFYGMVGIIGLEPMTLRM